MHHSVFDGTSLKVFLGDVGKAYMGMPFDNDYYYLMLKNREEAHLSDFYEESRKYFEERYDSVEWSSYPEVDHMSRENEMGEFKEKIRDRRHFFAIVAGIFSRKK